MAMIAAAAGRDQLAPAAALFHSLGGPTRLAIVRRLSEGEARVVDLVAELEMSQSAVSKHLACLLVTFRAEGRQSYYRLPNRPWPTYWPPASECSRRPGRRWPSARCTESEPERADLSGAQSCSMSSGRVALSIDRQATSW